MAKKKGQKGRKWYTKHYTEEYRFSNKNPA